MNLGRKWKKIKQIHYNCLILNYPIFCRTQIVQRSLIKSQKSYQTLKGQLFPIKMGLSLNLVPIGLFHSGTVCWFSYSIRYKRKILNTVDNSVLRNNIPKLIYKCNLLEYQIFQIQFLKPFVYVGIDYELQKKLKKQFGIIWKKLKFSSDTNNDAQEANIAFIWLHQCY